MGSKIMCKVSRNELGKITSVHFSDDGSGEDVQALGGVSSREIDWTTVTPFQEAVYQELMKVGRGETVSYAELAARVGRPGAARAIGTAMARNPFLFIVPCHRVIASDGSLGGFACGLDVKRKLIAAEKES